MAPLNCNEVNIKADRPIENSSGTTSQDPKFASIISGKAVLGSIQEINGKYLILQGWCTLPEQSRKTGITAKLFSTFKSSNSKRKTIQASPHMLVDKNCKTLEFRSNFWPGLMAKGILIKMRNTLINHFGIIWSLTRRAII